MCNVEQAKRKMTRRCVLALDVRHWTLDSPTQGPSRIALSAASSS